jgi:hypothetical protein
MIAAIVVPGGIRNIAMMRACLVAGRIVVFESEGAGRVRVLDLLVDREVERAAAFGSKKLAIGLPSHAWHKITQVVRITTP